MSGQLGRQRFEEILWRLRAAAAAQSESDLARALGISSQHLYALKQRGSIPLPRLVSFAERTGASLDWIVLGRSTPRPGQIVYIKTGFHETVAAKHRAIVDEHRAGAIVAELSTRYRLTEVHITRILRRAIK